jgi:hypothetical protein
VPHAPATVDRAAIVGCVAAGVIAALLAVVWLARRTDWRGLAPLVVAIALLSPTFALEDAGRSLKRSGLLAAGDLKAIVGDHATVTAGAILRYQPELFHYAGVQVETFGEHLPAPASLPGPRWVLMSDNEHAEWTRQAPERIERAEVIVSNKKRIHVVRIGA